VRRLRTALAQSRGVTYEPSQPPRSPVRCRFTSRMRISARCHGRIGAGRSNVRDTGRRRMATGARLRARAGGDAAQGRHVPTYSLNR
jgi:hypothetical protein